jgi:hypothetical protein
MDSYQDKYKRLPDKYNFGNLAFKALQINNRLVSDFKAKFPKIEECPDFAGSNLQTKLSSMRRQVEVLLDKLKVLCNNVFKADNRAKLAAMYEAIDTVRAHPEILLIHTFDVGGYSNPTRVKVSVEPKNKELKETFPQVIGDGPQPCDEAGGGQARQQQSGNGPTPEQPVVSATPKPSPTAP